MKELICIKCPKGCHLRVDEENGFTVTGHSFEIFGVCPECKKHSEKI